MNLIRFRFGLGALTTSLTLGLAWTWLNLHVSGYTYNADGSRDLGHLYKAVPEDLTLLAASSVIVLVLGLALIWLVRRFGPLTAPRLLLAAVLAGALVSGSVVTWMRWPFSVACPAIAAILALEFVVVADIPWRIRPNENGRDQLVSNLDRVVLAIASAGALASLLWIGWLISVAMRHPCDCG